MSVKVIRCLGGSKLGQVSRGSDRQETQVWSQAHGHHVFGYGFAKTYAGIKSTFNNINELPFRHQIEFYIGIKLVKTRNDSL